MGESGVAGPRSVVPVDKLHERSVLPSSGSETA